MRILTIRRRTLSSTILVIGSLLLSAAAQAQTTVDLSTGLSYASGEYGEVTSTETAILPLSLKIKSGSWTFRASTSYLRVNGPANVAVLLDDGGGRDSSGPGNGRDVTDGDSVEDPSATDRSSNGIGDTSVSATYSFNELGGSSVYLDLTGRVRLPTGDEDDGLGVGATDSMLASEIGIDGEQGGTYLSVGRRFLGNTDTLARKDGWQAGVGAWRDFGNSTSIGIGYDWRESSTATGSDPAEIYAYLNRKISDAWRIGLNASGGLNDASSDYSVGVSVTWRVSGD